MVANRYIINKTIQCKIFYIMRHLVLFIGFMIPLFCYNINPIDILRDPLSRFGIDDSTQLIWISFNTIMALALLIFGISSNNRIQNLATRRVLDYVLYTALSAFVLSGFITMDVRIIHIILAGLFFMLYVVYILIFGISYREFGLFKYAVALGIINIMFILTTISLNISYCIFEIGFICSIIFWNSIMNTKILK